MQSKILNHIEDLEYAKQYARELASQLADEVDVSHILRDDPESITDELLAAMIVLVMPYVERTARDAAQYANDLGLPELKSDDVTPIIESARDDVLTLGRAAIITAIGLAFAKIRDAVSAGVTLNNITTAITTDAARKALLSPLASALRRLASGFVQEVEGGVHNAALNAFRASGLESESEQAKLSWIAVMDKNTCDGVFEHACRPRHGKSKTLNEWRNLGLPRSPVLICSMYAHRGAAPCRCALSEENVGLAVPEPVRAAAAVKRGKDRAKSDANKRRMNRA